MVNESSITLGKGNVMQLLYLYSVYPAIDEEINYSAYRLWILSFPSI